MRELKPGVPTKCWFIRDVKGQIVFYGDCPIYRLTKRDAQEVSCQEETLVSGTVTFTVDDE